MGDPDCLEYFGLWLYFGVYSGFILSMWWGDIVTIILVKWSCCSDSPRIQYVASCPRMMAPLYFVCIRTEQDPILFFFFYNGKR